MITYRSAVVVVVVGCSGPGGGGEEEGSGGPRRRTSLSISGEAKISMRAWEVPRGGGWGQVTWAWTLRLLLSFYRTFAPPLSPLLPSARSEPRCAGGGCFVFTFAGEDNFFIRLRNPAIAVLGSIGKAEEVGRRGNGINNGGGRSAYCSAALDADAPPRLRGCAVCAWLEEEDDLLLLLPPAAAQTQPMMP
uniref:Uncharacterized protein n=1 Tax=Leersia perrieri TaxID=77586 RepID=A0A0D9X0V8_9ORYZ